MKPFFTFFLIPAPAAWNQPFIRICLHGFILFPTIFVPLNAQPVFPWAPAKESGTIQRSVTVKPDTSETIYHTFPFKDMLDFCPLKFSIRTYE